MKGQMPIYQYLSSCIVSQRREGEGTARKVGGSRAKVRKERWNREVDGLTPEETEAEAD